MEVLEARKRYAASTFEMVRVRLDDKGRLLIPAAMREAMGIAENSVLDLTMVGSELRVATVETRFREAQEWVKQIVPPGVSLADELMAERREAAKYE